MLNWEYHVRFYVLLFRLVTFVEFVFGGCWKGAAFLQIVKFVIQLFGN